MRTFDQRRAALFAKGVEAVFAGTEWLTAEEVGLLRRFGASTPRTAAARWHAQGKISGVQRSGGIVYPRYVFSKTWLPLKAVADVMRALADHSPMRIASWFESTNSFLGGKRPRELIGTDPQRVVAAAKVHSIGPVHG